MAAAAATDITLETTTDMVIVMDTTCSTRWDMDRDPTTEWEVELMLATNTQPQMLMTILPDTTLSDQSVRLSGLELLLTNLLSETTFLMQLIRLSKPGRTTSMTCSP